MKTTAEICKEAGLTYDGFAIGLPEEYYKENYPKEYLMDKLDSLIKRESKADKTQLNTEVTSVAYEKAQERLKRFRL